MAPSTHAIPSTVATSSAKATLPAVLSMGSLKTSSMVSIRAERPASPSAGEEDATMGGTAAVVKLQR